MKTLASTKLFGVTITTNSKKEILEYIITSLKNSTQKIFITTPNPEIIMYAVNYPEYKKVLNEANLALPDGIGLLAAARIFGLPVYHRVTGVDFVESLCEKAAENDVSIGLLGGRGGVAERTANCLRKKYPSLQISYIAEEYNEDKLKQARPDILLVAFGFPKQEEWIAQHLPNLPIKVAMGVGGTFDYISGQVVRAPKLVQSLGLEWFYRLIKQPWRWKRQLALLQFIALVIKTKIRG